MSLSEYCIVSHNVILKTSLGLEYMLVHAVSKQVVVIVVRWFGIFLSLLIAISPNKNRVKNGLYDCQVGCYKE